MTDQDHQRRASPWSDPAPDVLRVGYRSQRREIWDRYWRSWRDRLWKIHVGLFASVTALAVLALTKHGAPSPDIVALAAGCGLLSILWLPLYPQLMFKPQTRVLEIGRDGISTTISRCSAQRSWREIRSVSQDGDYVIFNDHNGDAFIVPPRAFQSADDRYAFLSFARRAFAASSVPAE